MNSLQDKRHLRSAWGLNAAGVLLLLTGMIMHAIAFFRYVVDDLYISLVYSRNLAQGIGLVYNGDLVVEGYSNFLWVLALALFARGEPVSLVFFAKVLGISLSLATLVLTWILSRRQIAEPRLALLPACLLVTSPWFVFWSTSGLETSLFTLLVTAGLLLYIHFEGNTIGSFFAGCVLALVAMTRPEGAIFFSIAIVWSMRRLLRLRAVAWSGVLGLLLGFLIVYVPYFFWRSAYYGYLFPNTVYVKAGGGLVRQALRGLQYLYHFIQTPYSFLSLLIPLLIWRSLPPAGRYLMVNVWAYLVFIVLSGGDWMPFYRFFVPLLPVMCVLLVTGLHVLYSAAGFRKSAMYLTVFALMVLFLVSSFDALFISRSIAKEIGPSDFRDGPLGWVAWLQENAPPDNRIAVVDAGAVAYYTQLEVIDMYGLLDSYIAHLPSRYPANPLQPAYNYAFGKWDNDYILRLQPDYIQMHISCQQLKHGEHFTQWVGTDELIQTSEFSEMYECVDAPGVAGLFRRGNTEEGD